MKVKRFFANVIVLLIFAALVFFAGWVQFAVKPGSCALMESKTGGLYDKPIVAGVFTWRWERLLPTNVKLTKFTLSPQKETASVTGQLPSGELYASFMSDKVADFSYNVETDVSLSFSPEAVHSLYSQGKISCDDDLKAYSSSAASLFASLLAEHLIETGQAVQNAALSQEEIRSIVQKKAEDFEGISVLSAQVVSSKIPDIALYERLKADCTAYLDSLKDKMEEQAQKQAEVSANQEKAIVRLERLGEVLSKYPQLEELFKTDEGSKILGTLNLSE